MENEILIALFTKLIDDRLAARAPTPGPRGQRGRQGSPGEGFDFSEHEETIRAWAKEFAIKFEDFTADQISALRGPRGQDGSPGKDFIIADHEALFRTLAEEFSLKFEDLDEEQIGALRGPRGKDGKDGKDGGDFIFDSHAERIESIVRSAVSDMHDSLKLRFSDLDADDIDKLRGPRGRDGRDGRDFIFDEHRGYFDTLRLKFSDLTDAERGTLKLRFSHLTEDEKAALKLQFKDLTDEELTLIRGPRGTRGQRGSAGRNGEDGKSIRGAIGPRGVMGLAGRTGAAGADGQDGSDGIDAPVIVNIDVEQRDDDIVFVFEFSDGSVIRSDRVKLPTPVVNGGGGSGRGRGALNLDTRIDEVSLTVTYVGKAMPGNLTSAAVWQIQKISVVGTETIIYYADGDAKYDNSWDARAGLTYA